MNTILVYLHGFNSAFDPCDPKIVSLDRVAATVGLTTNYLDPVEVKKLDDFIANLDTGTEEIILVGTSLGGYFARYFAKKHKLRCIIINPATKPFVTLHRSVGENINFKTGEKYSVSESDVLRLIDYNTVGPTGSGCLAILATDDELLDYRDAVSVLTDFGGGAEIVLTTGGHRLSDINSHLTAITAFVNSFPVS